MRSDPHISDMSYNDLKVRIKEHEGFVPKIYKDSLGFATIGYGHLVLSTDRFKEGVTYKKKDLEEVFDSDFNIAKSNANQLIKVYLFIIKLNVSSLRWYSNSVSVEYLNSKICGEH